MKERESKFANLTSYLSQYAVWVLSFYPTLFGFCIDTECILKQGKKYTDRAPRKHDRHKE
jgi:hypothetical protein